MSTETERAHHHKHAHHHHHHHEHEVDNDVERQANELSSLSSAVSPKPNVCALGGSTGNVVFDNNNKPKCVVEVRDAGVEVMVKERGKDWTKRDYWLPKPAPKVILQGVSIKAKSGQLVGIMGPSGCGKTTLLEMMACRLNFGMGTKARTTGCVMSNGKPVTPSLFKKKAVYVKQQDLLPPTSTVRECLTFSAMLRLPSSSTTEEKLKRVAEVESALGLTKCANTKIGGDFIRGVSGGERKRTAIGTEIISNPDIIVLDEPTTGLDSSTAYHVVKILQELARSGKIVICTIHQPRSNTFFLFDKLLLLNHGQMVYFGNALDSLSYFKPFGYKCPKNENGADFLLDTLATIPRDSQTLKDIVSLAQDKFKKQCQLDLEGETEGYTLGDVHSSPSASIWTQLLMLTQRQWRRNWRDPIMLLSSLIQYIVLALFMGAMYRKLGNDQQSVLDREGCLFYFVMNFTWTPLLAALAIIPTDRPLFNRERAAGYYGSTAWMIANIICDVPLEILFAVLASSISYWLAGLNSDPQKFGFFLFTIWLLLEVSAGLGLACGAFLPRLDLGGLLATLFILLFMSFSGFVINLDSIPVYFDWITWLSFYKWGFEATLVNEMEGNVTFTCDPVPCSTLGVNVTNCTLPCMYPDGHSVLVAVGMEDSNKWLSLMAIGIIAVVFYIIAYFTMRFLKMGRS
ncbi:ABC transporter [Pelomyxa schiedti]|nr:ABC transporter [Pelomyxa schiedti]